MEMETLVARGHGGSAANTAFLLFPSCCEVVDTWMVSGWPVQASWQAVAG